jgi:hypothetical protein
MHNANESDNSDAPSEIISYQSGSFIVLGVALELVSLKNYNMTI